MRLEQQSLGDWPDLRLQLHFRGVLGCMMGVSCCLSGICRTQSICFLRQGVLAPYAVLHSLGVQPHGCGCLAAPGCILAEVKVKSTGLTCELFAYGQGSQVRKCPTSLAMFGESCSCQATREEQRGRSRSHPPWLFASGVWARFRSPLFV